MTRLHSSALISPSSNKPLKKAVAEKAVTAFLLPVRKRQVSGEPRKPKLAVRKNGYAILESAKPNGLRDGKPMARDRAILADCRSEAECFFIKDKDAKALQMRSMQHVSRSGEKG